ncbi:Acetyltransferase (GNAT) family protein [Butyrivibrio sp. ob235]|nr:Acetyltransferase (GNAT) family protein [Butyrivibrio sp. ob235]
MKVELRNLTEENMGQCFGLRVAKDQMQYIASNEDPNDRYWLWRLMIDESLQGKGYGTAAIKEIIQYFKFHGANNIRLSTKDTNTNALSMYRKAGFRDTGEMNDEEIVLQLDF